MKKNLLEMTDSEKQQSDQEFLVKCIGIPLGIFIAAVALISWLTMPGLGL